MWLKTTTLNKANRMEITLTLQKSKVYEEVAQTTDYTGAKIEGSSGEAYDRIRTVDADNAELNRFWDECRAEVARVFKHILVGEDMYSTASATTPTASGDYYKLKLNVASGLSGFGGGFNTSLTAGMQLSLFSFFVQAITAKWYTYANKGEAEAYTVRAAASLDDVKQKAFTQQKPTRPTY